MKYFIQVKFIINSQISLDSLVNFLQFLSVNLFRMTRGSSNLHKHKFGFDV